MAVCTWTVSIVLAGAVGLTGASGCKKDNRSGGGDTYEIELTDYRPPPPPADEVLSDDKLEDKKHSEFDPALVDRRPLE